MTKWGQPTGNDDDDNDDDNNDDDDDYPLSIHNHHFHYPFL